MQMPFKLNIKAVSPPMSVLDSGKTVLIDRYGQKDTPVRTIATDERVNDDSANPELIYCENVLPTTLGYKSVGYSPLVLSTELTDFEEIYEVKDVNNNFGYLGITASGRTFLWAASLTWQDITPVGQKAGAAVSIAYASGITYICYSYFQIYTIDIPTKVLSAVTLTGITNSNIKGILDSNNYLVLYDEDTVYWSSALNPIDFVPSLATGAGSAIPSALGGNIVVSKSNVNGFIVFSTTNMIACTFSGNVQYPWIFKEIPNSAGVLEARHITATSEIGFNYAWTSAGLYKITPAGAVLILPEFSSFITNKRYETFDLTSLNFSYNVGTKNFKVRLVYVAARYLIISYGIESFTHALVYDTVTRRSSRLAIDHAAFFNLSIDIVSASRTYKSTAPLTYTEAGNLTYNSNTASTSAGASLGANIAVCKPDGSVAYLDTKLASMNHNAVLLLGKYQITRSSFIDVHNIMVETLRADNTNLKVYLIPSYDGKTFATAPQELTVLNLSAYHREYGSDMSAYNISLLLVGTFDLTNILLVASQGGRP